MQSRQTSYLFGILALLCGSASAQNAPVMNVTDTVFIGIVNKVKLNQKSERPQLAQSVDASVALEGTDLVIRPHKQGQFIVDIIYRDTIIKRKFFSTYLPKPSVSD